MVDGPNSRRNTTLGWRNRASIPHGDGGQAALAQIAAEVMSLVLHRYRRDTGRHALSGSYACASSRYAGVRPLVIASGCRSSLVRAIVLGEVECNTSPSV